MKTLKVVFKEHALFAQEDNWLNTLNNVFFNPS